MSYFAQKAALVTGGAARLGRAMALALAEDGYDVAIHFAHSDTAANELADDIRAMGRAAQALQADLLESDQVESLVACASDALGKPLTCLVNNASIFEYDEMSSVTPTSWDRHINSNLRAPVFLTQAFAAQAPAAATDARGEPIAQANVVNLIDQRVRKLTPAFMSYTLAKSALWTFTQTAAQALAPNIRVNAIGPGPTLIGHRQTPEHFAAQRANTVLERGSNPEDIVAALRYFLSAPGVTGQLICTDGGQHLGWKTPDIVGNDG